VVPAAAAPLGGRRPGSWLKSYQTIVEHQILSLVATKYAPPVPDSSQLSGTALLLAEGVAGAEAAEATHGD
jgi:hypothetical protein